MRGIVISGLALVLGMVGPTSAEVLGNQDIINLVVAGLPEEVIVAKIASSDQNYDLSTDQLLALKAKGLSGPILAAMINRATPKAVAPALSLDSADPAVPHPAGVYLLDDADGAARMWRMDPTVTNQAKTGGILGYALTGGIASLSIKASIQNESARVASTVHRPVFYFFFDESNAGFVQTTASNWSAGSAATVTAPSEFSLVQLAVKKGRREARVGSTNIAGAKTGVLDSDRLTFSYDLVRPGVYKVTPQHDLPSGQFAFIYSLQGSASAGALTARIFDFGVK